MNYEEFYQNVQVMEKGLGDKLKSAQKSFKNITKASGGGDLKSLTKELAQMKSALSELEDLTEKLKELTDGFDAKEYFESGDFARQMIDYCNQNAVDVKGESPTYEIFPYKVKIDAENQDVYINRKKVQCARPLSFVRDLKQNMEKYVKAPFNINVFLNELESAYKLAVIVKGSKNNNTVSDSDLLLRDLYDYVAPTQRARREYDLNNYAFDLARLYASGVEETKNGVKFVFGTSKITSKLIRILDQYGNEQFLGTIRFYNAQ